MTAIDTEAEQLAGYALTAAQAVLGTLPGAEGWTVEVGDTADAVPGSAARAVIGQAGAVTVALILDADLARHVQVGPPPADDLVEGCRAGLLAAASALDHLHGGGSVGELTEADVSAVAARGTDGAAVAVRLLADGAHRATLVVGCPPPAADDAPDASPFGTELPTVAPTSSLPSGLELLHDVEMDVTAELGRTRMAVREILELVPGSVIELDRAAGSPVDVLVNGTLIARGEVVVIDEEFGIRITDVIGHEEGRSR